MPRLLLLDFDGTITQTDTISTLAASIIGSAKTIHPSDWDGIVSAWLADYNRHVGAYVPKVHARTDPASELVFQESLKGVETASLARVESAGLFRGVSGGELRMLGRRAVEEGTVQLRAGVVRFLQEVAEQKRDGNVGIVSVNWSRDWVAGVLDAAAGLGGLVEGNGNSMVNRTDAGDGAVEGPSGFGRGRPLVTAGDKLAAARRAVQEWEEHATDGGRGWVYVGDSLTDLGCLLDASLGVVMADTEDTKLLVTLRRIGCEVRHVGESTGTTLPKLVWARDFVEVLESEILELAPA